MKNVKKVLAIVFSLTMLVGVSTLGITQETAMAEIERPSYQQASSTQQASEGLDYQLSEDGKYYIVAGIGDCTDTELIIPDTYEGLPVKEIRNSAFYENSSLTSVTIPNSVTNIDDGAFHNCLGLTSFTIPDSVTRIGNSAFGWCKSLTNVTIGNGVTMIDVGTFGWCESLTSVTIPDSVTVIGMGAFAHCGLTEIVIPESVTSIGSTTFNGCSALTSIIVDENNENYSSLDGNLYNKDQTQLIRYAIGKTATSFVIPDGVTSIGPYAFEDSGLTSVTIPDGVTSIGSGAFDMCSALTSITIPDGVTSIGSAAFGMCSALTSITIPASVTSIGDQAFIYSGIISITFKGTKAEWEAVEKGEDWNIHNATVVCLGDKESERDKGKSSGCGGCNGCGGGCSGIAGISTCFSLLTVGAFLFCKKKDEN